MPSIAVIVPVLNEQSTVQGLIQNLEHLCGQNGIKQGIAPNDADEHDIEVILVDGDRQGSTLNSLKKKPNWVRGRIAQPSRGHQMNVGVQASTAETLLFLHADTRLPNHALSLIQSSLAAPEIQGGAFDFEILSPRWALKLVSLVSSWRSRLTRIPYGDQAIFIRRSAFEAVGGFPDIPIMEDVALMRSLKVNGYPICFLKDRVGISARRWETEGIMYCTLRNWSLMLLYNWGMSPHQLLKWYKPHESIKI